MTARTAPLLIVMTTAALAAAAPLGAAAADPSILSDTTKVLVDGMSGNDIFLNGHYVPRNFAVDPAGHLNVTGTLSGAITGPPGSSQKRIDQVVTLPVDRGASDANCAMSDLYLGPADQSLAGIGFHIDRADLHLELNQGPGSRLRVPMCEFADELPSDMPDAQLADTLNQILDLRATVQPAT